MPTDNTNPQRADEAPTPVARTVLAIVERLAQEMHPGPGRAHPTLDSDLERDLGLDSLGRVELLLRVGRALQTDIPEQALATVETVRDLVRAAGAGASLASPPAAAMEPGPGAHETVALPHRARTLNDILLWHARHHPARIHIVWLDGQRALEITYGELLDGARGVAAGLLADGLRPGQSVALMLPTGPDYFYSFFGVLLAGGIPVPIYPPGRPSQLEDHLRRHAGILGNALAVALITVPEASRASTFLQAKVDTLSRVTTVAQLAAGTPPSVWPEPRPGDTALLQYTSGSTGNPKGVILSHDNLLANIRAMGQAIQAGPHDTFVSWLPLYHDMGLIGAWLGSLYHACRLVIMSPLAFLARPSRWLWAIHHHRGTLSAAPNFAYELCCSKIEARELAGLDLGSWRRAFNGAEPIGAPTLRAFTARYAPYGFRESTMTPVYGLAECSVGLAFPPLERTPPIDRVDRDAFARSGRAVQATPKTAHVAEYVACGRPLRGHEIRIVDEQGRVREERAEGRLQFKGPSATAGYFRNPDATRALFDGDWRESGDLAYRADGDIYITGRIKEIIIRGGRNLYPYELEQAVGSLPGIRKGCVAVFGSPDPRSGTERLVVLAETREPASAQEALRARINALGLELIGSAPDDIVLAPPYTILKTSSGKIRRAATREIYERHQVGKSRALGRQRLRLTLSGALSRLRRRGQRAIDGAYGVYAHALFWLIAPLTWFAVVATANPRRGFRHARTGARILLRACAVPFAVHGQENLPEGPCILVINHQSYLDGVILVAALPRPFSVVAKRELARQWIAGNFLRHLGASFVDRSAPRRGARDVSDMGERLRRGEPLAFFPEGTFRADSGLLSFRMGAFVIAAENAAPVVPVGIRGTRWVLPDGRWLPRRGRIGVFFGAPLSPAGATFAEAIKLRDAARHEVLRLSGESDLGQDAPLPGETPA
ncbi:MAG: AMP-binding protein [Betaproteobacteria bacterium]|nr:AMP-binding protein [Betaproteobacteria bacterium]